MYFLTVSILKKKFLQFWQNLHPLQLGPVALWDTVFIMYSWSSHFYCSGPPWATVTRGTRAFLWDYTWLDKGIGLKGDMEEDLWLSLAFILPLSHRLLHTLHIIHSPSARENAPPVYPAARDRVTAQVDTKARGSITALLMSKISCIKCL